MEKKSMLQYFRESAGSDQGFAERIVKTLVANNIYTVDLLLSKDPVDILRIKGIGPRAMNLISRVMTKAECDKKHMEALYKKHCSKCQPTTLHEWFENAGVARLESFCIEKILRKNGITSVDIFLKKDFSDYDVYTRGVGKKRVESIMMAQRYIKEQKGLKDNWNGYVKKKEMSPLPVE